MAFQAHLAGVEPHVVGEREAVEVSIVRAAGHAEISLRGRVIQALVAEEAGGEGGSADGGGDALAERAREPGEAIGAGGAGRADIGFALRAALGPEPDREAAIAARAIGVGAARSAGQNGARGGALPSDARETHRALVAERARVSRHQRVPRGAGGRLGIADQPGATVARLPARVADAELRRARAAAAELAPGGLLDDRLPVAAADPRERARRDQEP